MFRTERAQDRELMPPEVSKTKGQSDLQDEFSLNHAVSFLSG